MMKKKDLSIWRVLLTHRNEIVSVEAISYATKLSRRQIISRIPRMGSPYVIRQESKGGLDFILECGMSEAIDETVRLLTEYYGCSADEIHSVVDAVSPAGTMTIDDVQEVTGLSSSEVAYVLYMMPNITAYKSGTKNQYIMKV